MNRQRFLIHTVLFAITCIIVSTLTVNQSHAMMRSATPRLTLNILQGARRMGTTTQNQTATRRRHFLTGAALTGGALCGIPYLLLERSSMDLDKKATLYHFLDRLSPVSKRNRLTKAVPANHQTTPAHNTTLTTEEREKRELTTLHASNQESYAKYIRAVIASGKNPHEFITENRETPLLKACLFKDSKLFKLLIEHNGGSLINDLFNFKYEQTQNIGKDQTIVSYVIDNGLDIILEDLLSNPHIDIDFEKTDRLIEPERQSPERTNRLYKAYRTRQQEQKDNNKKKMLMQKLNIQTS